MKWVIGLLGIILTASLVFAMPAKRPTMLTWDPPTTNTDGTPLTDLSGYKVYWSTTSGSYSDVKSKDVGNVVKADIKVITGSYDVDYYFVVTAYDTFKNESAFSNEVSSKDPLVPGAPGNLKKL